MFKISVFLGLCHLLVNKVKTAQEEGERIIYLHEMAERLFRVSLRSLIATLKECESEMQALIKPGRNKKKFFFYFSTKTCYGYSKEEPSG